MNVPPFLLNSNFSISFDELDYFLFFDSIYLKLIELYINTIFNIIYLLTLIKKS